MEKATIPLIAKRLGVSIGTIDRAIHDRLGINPKTKEKILDELAKCNYKTDKIGRSLSLKSKKLKIGVIIQSIPDFYWSCVKNGIKEAGGELLYFGVEIVFKDLEGYRISTEIIQKIDELIEENVTAIVLIPTDNPLLKQKINDVSDSGITVVTLNDDISDSKRLFYVGPHFRQSGRLAGRLMGLFLQGKGNVITLNTSMESLEYKERIEGFIEMIDDEYKQIKLISSYSYINQVKWDGSENILKSILENTQGINGIYDVCGGSLHVVGKIIKNDERLKNVVLIGHESWSDVNELIHMGVIKACISQDPYSQGYIAIKQLYKYLEDGIKPESERMYTKLDIIIKDNLEEHNNIVKTNR